MDGARLAMSKGQCSVDIRGAGHDPPTSIQPAARVGKYFARKVPKPRPRPVYIKVTVAGRAARCNELRPDSHHPAGNFATCPES